MIARIFWKHVAGFLETYLVTFAAVRVKKFWKAGVFLHLISSKITLVEEKRWVLFIQLMHLFRYLVFKSAYPSFTQMQQTLLCWASFLLLVLLDQIEIASCLGLGTFVAGYPFDTQALDCILYSLYINYVPTIKWRRICSGSDNGDPKIRQSCFVINVPCFYQRTVVHRTSYS